MLRHIRSSSKYKAIRTEIDGIKFDSRAEGRRYSELKLLEKSGAIQNLMLQVPFVLVEKSKYGREIKYKADFTYYEDGKYIVEDVKGMKTDVYKLKKRLLAEKYGIEIKETK